jgi:2-polyprenyl-6-methoxyphenol hydroxylase-like FAD-dependent oxidoreductase
MPESPGLDVLVIGAGPVGLTLASELLRHGAKVRIVEKNSELCQHPNAAVVHVRTLEILAAMGAVDGFLKEGFPLPGMHIRAFGKRIGYVDIGGIDSPYPNPRTLGQQYTVRLLNQHFEKLGGQVEFQVEGMGFEQDADGVRVRLVHHARKDREEIAAAKFVVGCEGSASITRQTLGIDFPGERYLGKEFLQTDARVRWTFPHGFAYQFVTDDYILLLFPYDATGHYRIICARADHDPDNEEPPTLEEMQELVQEVTDPTAELYDPAWFNRFRSGHRLAATFRQGRAFLAGDAGHVHVPIGGQGMNYGMHDAFNLAWKLAAVAKGEAKPELLDTYMAERHPADKALIRGTDVAFHLMVEPHALKNIVMKTVMPTLLHLEPLRQQIRNTLAEMNVAYPASPLTEDRGGSHGPMPGDRAPDALVVRMPSRETMHLFDVLRDPRWALLLFAGVPTTTHVVEALEKISAPLAKHYGARMAIHLVLGDTPPVPVHENWAADFLMDRAHYIHEKYGVTAPCLYLIRPDWHIAFRGGLDDAKRLGGYLARVLG